MTTWGVLFDMDGVLVDSASLHLRAYERVFRDLGLDFPDVARDAVLSGMARLQVLDRRFGAMQPESEAQALDQ